MKFYPDPNYLLEALVYLGNVANRHEASSLEERLIAKGVEDLAPFKKEYAPFAQPYDSLDLNDGIDPADEDGSSLLMDAVLKMNAPPESRLTILEANRGYKEIISETRECLRPVLAALQQEKDCMDMLAERVYREFMDNGIEQTLRQTSSVTLQPEMEYHLRPLVLSPGMNLFADWPGEGVVMFYCGAMRQFLLRQLDAVSYNAGQVYGSIKVLGDRTRFEILCYLRQGPAYGQELSNHFGLARNTIHHHMSKLHDEGLVTCTVDGNRVYYAINAEKVSHLLEMLSSLFGRD